MVVVPRQVLRVDEQVVVSVQLPELAVDHVEVLVGEELRQLVDVRLLLQERHVLARKPREACGSFGRPGDLARAGGGRRAGRDLHRGQGCLWGQCLQSECRIAGAVSTGSSAPWLITQHALNLGARGDPPTPRGCASWMNGRVVHDVWKAVKSVNRWPDKQMGDAGKDGRKVGGHVRGPRPLTGPPAGRCSSAALRT